MSEATKVFPADDNHLIKNAVLKRPEEIVPDERPTVSLHLLAKNAESCIERLLKNVTPCIDEVVMISNDTDDDTDRIVRSHCKDKGIDCNIIPVTAKTHPEFYIMDVPETYAVGKPLANESFVGPFTGEPILARWADIRNVGWNRCNKDWRLFLDADDVVVDPECIPGLCLSLAEHNVELACSRYIYSQNAEGGSRADSFRERLAINLPHIEWVGITHEVLRGQEKTAHVEGNLIVKDMRDNKGAGIRIPGRCFKVLYQFARSNDWQVSPRYLIYLATECKNDLPDLARAVLDLYLQKSLWPEERAWACVMVGEIHENVGEYDDASRWYEKSLVEHPGSKAAFRLCRSRFHEGKWQASIDAYNLGVENKVVIQLIDNGPAYEDMSKILVAAAFNELGRKQEALLMADEALKVYPRNTALIAMRSQLQDRIAP